MIATLKHWIMKSLFGNPLIRVMRASNKASSLQVWLQQHNSSDSFVDPRIEFIGRSDWFNCVRIHSGAGLERDITIWISPDTGAEPELILGEKVFIGRNTYLGVYKPVRIGNCVLIGAYSYLISANHNFERRDIPIREQGFSGAPIVIEDDAWLGTHVVVLPGVTIGRGAVIGAGSVVTCDVPAWQIWGGVPARFIRARPE